MAWDENRLLFTGSTKKEAKEKAENALADIEAKLSEWKNRPIKLCDVQEIKPTVIDEKIVARSILPLTGTFDHRIMDGGQIGKLARGVARRLAKPEELDSIEKASE